jgi:hypothetical protein
MQGTLMEKLLTHSPEEFLRLTRCFDNSVAMTKEPKREAYRYAMVSFLFILSPLFM